MYKMDSLNQFLLTARYTVATAESCTSGALASSFTDTPSSSVYFQGGVVVYNDRVKVDVLHVPQDIITRFTAQSGQCANRMSQNVSELFYCRFGVSTTGNMDIGPVYCSLYDQQTQSAHLTLIEPTGADRVERKLVVVDKVKKWMLSVISEIDVHQARSC